jgi:hypothetical protein
MKRLVAVGISGWLAASSAPDTLAWGAYHGGLAVPATTAHSAARSLAVADRGVLPIGTAAPLRAAAGRGRRTALMVVPPLAAGPGLRPAAMAAQLREAVGRGRPTALMAAAHREAVGRGRPPTATAAPLMAVTAAITVATMAGHTAITAGPITAGRLSLPPAIRAPASQPVQSPGPRSALPPPPRLMRQRAPTTILRPTIRRPPSSDSRARRRDD